MSTGLAVFDKTIQESNVWLKAIEAGLRPCDRRDAYDAFRAVTHTLRDHLETQAVLGVSAQLPMLLRGVFLEGWRPDHAKSGARNLGTFAAAVEKQLPGGFPRQAPEAVDAVLEVLADRLDPGETRKIINQLPAALRDLWPTVYQ